MKNESTKRILIWFGKLVILTAAIYWFMTKGLTISVGESVGLGASGTSAVSSPQGDSPDISAPLYAGLLIAFLAFAIGRSIYEKHVSKPKSEMYKRFRDLK